MNHFMDLPPEWEAIPSEYGLPYYYNRWTNESACAPLCVCVSMRSPVRVWRVSA